MTLRISLAIAALTACVAPAGAQAPDPAAAAEARCAARIERESATKADAEAALGACAEAVAANSSSPRARYLHGRALYLLERDDDALSALAAAAEAGSADAARLLGLMHRWGYGVAADPVKAVRFYRQALNGGATLAAIDLADAMRDGTGIAKDLAGAADLYRQAADAGLARGALGLGYAYETGAGVAPDIGRAVALYRTAAAKGDPQAQYNLGVLADQGRGLKRDRAEALRWYRLSAAGGSTEAIYALALAHQNGTGVARDLAEAERWLLKGIEAGDAIDAPNGLAFLYARQGRDLDKAAALAEGALKAAPDNAAVMDTLGLIRLRQGRPAEAAAVLETSVAADPTALHHARLGDAYQALGRVAEAREAWRRALAALDASASDGEPSAAGLRRKISGR
jgi:TPR repeat protein